MMKAVLKAACSIMLFALVVCGLSVSAYAMSGEEAGTSLLFTYYDVRSAAAGGLGLTDNYYTVTNITTHWVQAHVRVRTGKTSVELLDFDVLLSPKDVFTFDLYEDAGATVFASCDSKTLVNSNFTLNFDRNGDGTNDCWVIDSTTFPAMLSLIMTCDGSDAATALAATKKGYVEVLSEGLIIPCGTSGTSKDVCSGPDDTCGTPDDVTIAKKMLNHTNSTSRLADTTEGTGLCGNDVDTSNFDRQILIGRQYYATVASGVITRMAQLNGEVMDDFQPFVAHVESYDAERVSSRCAGTDINEGCWAYVAAVAGDTVANGADDLNYCYYKSKLLTTDPANNVANKFGAAATFGPTIGDINNTYQRDGTLAQFASMFNNRNYFSNIYATYNGGDFYEDGEKDFANSHFFYVPAPAPYDVATSFAFIFPMQHFIAEKEVITLTAMYDNEENKHTIDPGKFISPGLPTPSTFADEAALYKLNNPPFSEGWVTFAVSATNGTNGCTETDTNANSCEVYFPQGSDASVPYTPGYTGAVFNMGANFLSVSHFQYSNE